MHKIELSHISFFFFFWDEIYFSWDFLYFRHKEQISDAFCSKKIILQHSAFIYAHSLLPSTVYCSVLQQLAGLTLIPRFVHSLVSKTKKVEQSRMNTVNICFYWKQTERTSSVPYIHRQSTESCNIWQGQKGTPPKDGKVKNTDTYTWPLGRYTLLQISFAGKYFGNRWSQQWNDACGKLQRNLPKPPLLNYSQIRHLVRWW